jgi:hypothetical protein
LTVVQKNRISGPARLSEFNFGNIQKKGNQKMKPLLTSAILVSLWVSAFGQTDGLIAHYSFEGNTRNNLGTSLALVATGAGFSAEGIKGSCVTFNGTTDYLQSTENISLSGNDSRSVSVWAYLERHNDHSVILDIGGIPAHPLTPHGTLFSIGVEPGNAVYLNASFRGIGTPSIFTLKKWTHIAFSFDKGTGIASFYLDGRKVASGALQLATPADQRFYVSFDPARRRDGWNDPWTGKVDELRLYSRALTEAEVSAIYQMESSPTPSPSAKDGLIAAYSFDKGNADDDSGNARNGIVNGATLVPDRFGRPSSAYSFGKLGDHIRIANSVHPQGEVTLTYSAWINLSREIVGTPDVQTVLNIGSVGANGIFINNSRSAALIISASQIDYVADNNDFPTASAAIQPNAWHHLVVTKNQRVVRSFLDGVLKGAGSLSSGQNVTSKELYIGSNGSAAHANGEQFFGKIDDVRIYNRALSDTEVAAFFAIESQAPNPLPLPPLVNAFTLQRLAFSNIQGFRLALAPPDRTAFRIETSVDLIKWAPLFSFPTNSGNFEVIDATAVPFSSRFYRAVKP